MKTNHDGLPYLDQYLLDLVFSCVYHDEDALEAIVDPQTRAFVDTLLAMQHYNVTYRSAQLRRTFPPLAEAIGRIETPDGTQAWLALALAIQELYGMRPDTLKAVLRQVTVRK